MDNKDEQVELLSGSLIPVTRVVKLGASQGQFAYRFYTDADRSQEAMVVLRSANSSPLDQVISALTIGTTETIEIPTFSTAMLISPRVSPDNKSFEIRGSHDRTGALQFLVATTSGPRYIDIV